MNNFSKKVLTVAAAVVCAGSVFAFPGPRGHFGPRPVPVHRHYHHHHCGGGHGLFRGIAIAGTAMAGAALVSDIIATQRAASQPQTVVVQHPAPVVVQPTPVVVQQPAPVVVQQPVVAPTMATTVVAPRRVVYR